MASTVQRAVIVLTLVALVIGIVSAGVSGQRNRGIGGALVYSVRQKPEVVQEKRAEESKNELSQEFSTLPFDYSGGLSWAGVDAEVAQVRSGENETVFDLTEADQFRGYLRSERKLPKGFVDHYFEAIVLENDIDIQTMAENVRDMSQVFSEEDFGGLQCTMKNPREFVQFVETGQVPAGAEQWTSGIGKGDLVAVTQEDGEQFMRKWISAAAKTGVSPITMLAVATFASCPAQQPDFLIAYENMYGPNAVATQIN